MSATPIVSSAFTSTSLSQPGVTGLRFQLAQLGLACLVDRPGFEATFLTSTVHVLPWAPIPVQVDLLLKQR